MFGILFVCYHVRCAVMIKIESEMMFIVANVCYGGVRVSSVLLFVVSKCQVNRCSILQMFDLHVFVSELASLCAPIK